MPARRPLKFCCDRPGCKSACELSHPDDLARPRTALSKRGWFVYDFLDRDTFLCPAHAELTAETRDAIRAARAKTKGK